MDIKVLEDFLTVTGEKNITKAANTLNMTQPVLSRRLMGLEEEFGIKLFERKGRGIVLTEDGQELKERAQKMVVLYKDMRETFDKKGNVIRRDRYRLCRNEIHVFLWQGKSRRNSETISECQV
ncbi:MAG: LysR family transcriptional regulator [Lachnoclostridium sp.]